MLLWGETIFQQIKILRIFLIVGHPRDPKGENHGYLTTFRGINAPKSRPFKYENNAQTLPKQLQNNFEKVDFHPKIRPTPPHPHRFFFSHISIFFCHIEKYDYLPKIVIFDMTI